MPTAIIVEGKLDAAVVRYLCSPTLAENDVPEPEDNAGGREQAIFRAATALRFDARIVLLLDRNGHTESQLHGEIERQLRTKGRDLTRTGDWYVKGRSGFRLVMAGLDRNLYLSGLGINTWSMDDYILRLMLDEDCFSAFRDHEKKVHSRNDAPALRSALEACAGVLRQHAVAMNSSKRYLDLVDAILGFNASPKGRFDRLVAHCRPETVSEVFGELKRQLLTDPPFEPN